MERVARDRPLQIELRETKVTLNGRQRQVDDETVEDEQEGRDRQDRQREPGTDNVGHTNRLPDSATRQLADLQRLPHDHARRGALGSRNLGTRNGLRQLRDQSLEQALHPLLLAPGRRS
jgi:hypothetical protein